MVAAAARPEQGIDSTAPVAGLSLTVFVCVAQIFLFFFVAGTAVTSDDVVTRCQESLTEAFGLNSAVKFDFVDIGAELDRHKIRHMSPVEASTSCGFFAYAFLVLFDLSGMAANNGRAEVSNGVK